MADAPNVREHLANERTFLAWVRTSIALLGFGVLIAKLRFLGLSPHGGRLSTLLGLAFASSGLLSLVFAAWHYARTRRAIDDGDFSPSPHLVLAFGGVLIGLGLTSVLYLLSILR